MSMNNALIEVTNETVIAVDFDNTLFYTNYPQILAPIPQIITLIRYYKDRGATIVLWTCREGEHLQQAIDSCKEHHIPIDYVNENPPFKIEKWGNDCRKIGADLYIDDKAVCALDLCE